MTRLLTAQQLAVEDFRCHHPPGEGLLEPEPLLFTAIGRDWYKGALFRAMFLTL